MALPTGVIFIWTGTNASIPAGWERVTDLDDKFPKGIADGTTEPNVTGGSATHSHNATANHSHTMNDHTHTFTVNGAYGGQAGTQTNSENTAGPNHTHTGGTTGSRSGGDLSSVSATYSAISNNPPYKTVIFIKPTSPAGGLPNLGVGFSDDTLFANNSGKYNGYYKCDGQNGTPDYDTKFIRGASAGADAGTTGGSSTNIHEIVHTHTVATHTHTFASGTVNSILRDSDPSVTNEFSNTHTHSGNLTSVSDTLSAGNPSVTTSETVIPLNKKLLMIQNRSSTVYTPVGIIGMWLGTLANIPSNFELVSSMYGYYPRKTVQLGEIGDVTGSNTHTHTGNTHSHTGSHDHGTTTVSHTASIDRGSSTTYTYIDSLRGGPVYHDITTNTASTTYSNATTDADSASNEPEYRTVAFIKYKGEKGGAFLFNFVR
jgi:hypothetical protein